MTDAKSAVSSPGLGEWTSVKDRIRAMNMKPVERGKRVSMGSSKSDVGARRQTSFLPSSSVVNERSQQTIVPEPREELPENEQKSIPVQSETGLAQGTDSEGGVGSSRTPSKAVLMWRQRQANQASVRQSSPVQSDLETRQSPCTDDNQTMGRASPRAPGSKRRGTESPVARELYLSSVKSRPGRIPRSSPSEQSKRQVPQIDTEKEKTGKFTKDNSKKDKAVLRSPPSHPTVEKEEETKSEENAGQKNADVDRLSPVKEMRKFFIRDDSGDPRASQSTDASEVVGLWRRKQASISQCQPVGAPAKPDSSSTRSANWTLEDLKVKKKDTKFSPPTTVSPAIKLAMQQTSNPENTSRISERAGDVAGSTQNSDDEETSVVPLSDEPLGATPLSSLIRLNEQDKEEPQANLDDSLVVNTSQTEQPGYLPLSADVSVVSESDASAKVKGEIGPVRPIATRPNRARKLGPGSIETPSLVLPSAARRAKHVDASNHMGRNEGAETNPMSPAHSATSTSIDSQVSSRNSPRRAMDVVRQEKKKLMQIRRRKMGRGHNEIRPAQSLDSTESGTVVRSECNQEKDVISISRTLSDDLDEAFSDAVSDFDQKALTKVLVKRPKQAATKESPSVKMLLSSWADEGDIISVGTGFSGNPRSPINPPGEIHKKKKKNLERPREQEEEDSSQEEELISPPGIVRKPKQVSKVTNPSPAAKGEGLTQRHPPMQRKNVFDRREQVRNSGSRSINPREEYAPGPTPVRRNPGSSSLMTRNPALETTPKTSNRLKRGAGQGAEKTASQEANSDAGASSVLSGSSSASSALAARACRVLKSRRRGATRQAEVDKFAADLAHRVLQKDEPSSGGTSDGANDDDSAGTEKRSNVDFDRDSSKDAITPSSVFQPNFHVHQVPIYTPPQVTRDDVPIHEYQWESGQSQDEDTLRFDSVVRLDSSNSSDIPSSGIRPLHHENDGIPPSNPSVPLQSILRRPASARTVPSTSIIPETRSKTPNPTGSRRVEFQLEGAPQLESLDSVQGMPRNTNSPTREKEENLGKQLFSAWDSAIKSFDLQQLATDLKDGVNDGVLGSVAVVQEASKSFRHYVTSPLPDKSKMLLQNGSQEEAADIAIEVEYLEDTYTADEEKKSVSSEPELKSPEPPPQDIDARSVPAGESSQEGACVSPTSSKDESTVSRQEVDNDGTESAVTAHSKESNYGTGFV